MLSAFVYTRKQDERKETAEAFAQNCQVYILKFAEIKIWRKELLTFVLKLLS
jgi:hypothetical protein